MHPGIKSTSLWVGEGGEEGQRGEGIGVVYLILDVCLILEQVDKLVYGTMQCVVIVCY